jgi:hypothetical protein
MEHGKFQLALAQALMGRPLPSDFGMQLSKPGRCTSHSSGMTEGRPYVHYTNDELQSEGMTVVERGDDLILLQESVNE